MAANTVHVQNISAQTDDKEIRDFFSFWKITSINVTPADGASKSATVAFEKETAAKTALLLNNTQLGSTHITVTSASGASTDDAEHATTNAERDSDEITQEEKPRSRILAEYLAHGYVIGDAALQRALDLDHTHGVSNRFMNTLTSLDSKYHATDRAKSADQSYGITERANSLMSGLSSYFEKAASTPTGRKLVDYYAQGQRQVTDVHNEARRLAELKKQEAGGSAYKAAGLEKVFGKEKEHASATSAAGVPAKSESGAATTNVTTQPPAPAGTTPALTESTAIQPPSKTG